MLSSPPPPPPGFFFFLHSRVLCVYFMRHSFFVLTLPHFAFCLQQTNKQTTQTNMPPAGLEPAIPPSERSQALALDRPVTGIGSP